MIITYETPTAGRLLVIKDGTPVGLVQEINTDTMMMKRYDLEAWKKWQAGGLEPELIVEPYDELMEMSP